MNRTWALEELVPHAAPMILIDDVDQEADGSVQGTVRITEQSVFFEPNRGVPAYVGIEYIAQTVAALVGLNVRGGGGEIQIGYLLGARNYRTDIAYFPLGALLQIRVSAEFESDDLAAYRGEILDSNGRSIAQTTITLFSGTTEANA